MFSSQQRGPPPLFSGITEHLQLEPVRCSTSPPLNHIQYSLRKTSKRRSTYRKSCCPAAGSCLGPGREPTALLLLPCQSPVPLLRSRSSALIESHRTWNFFTLWGPVNMMSMWAGSLFDPVSWLQFKVILSGVPWPLLHAHRVFSSFAWTRHNKSTLITGP